MILKSFEDSSGKIWIKRAGIKEAFGTNPKNAFVERDLYSIVQPDGTKDVSLETGFSRLEGLTSQFFSELQGVVRSGGCPALTENTWELCHLFLYFNFKRGPAFIRNAARNVDLNGIVGNGLKDIREKFPSAYDGEDQDVVIERIAQGIRVAAQSLYPSKRVKQAYDALGLMVLFVSNARHSMIIGDGRLQSVKIGNDNVSFTPIAHDMALAFYDQRREVIVREVDGKTVRLMNESTARQSSMIAGRSKALVLSLCKFMSLESGDDHIGAAGGKR